VSARVEDVIERPTTDAPANRRLLTVSRLSGIALALVVLLDLAIPVVFALAIRTCSNSCPDRQTIALVPVTARPTIRVFTSRVPS
jgi:hypothetical protein